MSVNGNYSRAKSEWADGWGLVLAASLGNAVNIIHLHVIGALTVPLTDTYGWSRGEIGLALTIFSVLSPFLFVVMGVITDRFGARRTALVGSVLFGISYSLVGTAGDDLKLWYIYYTIFTVFLQGTCSVVWSRPIVAYFHAQRGLALALSFSATGLVIAITPTIVVRLVSQFGISNTFYIIGSGAGVLLFLVTFFLFKIPDSGVSDKQENTDGTEHLPGLSFRQTVAGTTFWRLVFVIVCLSMALGFFIGHFQPLLIDGGMSAAQAAAIAGLIGPAMIVGRLATGFSFDRFPLKWVASIVVSFPAIACALLVTTEDTVFMLSLVAIVVGLGIGAEVDVAAYLTSRYFGLKRYSTIFAVIIGIYAGGIGVNSMVAGRIFDQIGTYDPVLVFIAAGVFLSSLVVALMPRPPAAFE